MKWLCLTAFVLVILMTAYAGFQLLTVSPNDIERVRLGLTEEEVAPAPRPAPRQQNPQSEGEGNEATQPEANTPTRAEESPALSTGIMGTEREQSRLSEIERGRQSASDRVEETITD